MQRTMSPEEAHAVAQLQHERESNAGKISVEEVALGLNVSSEQVETLLDEVRHRQVSNHAREVADHRRRDMRRVALAFVFAVAVIAGGFAFLDYQRSSRMFSGYGGSYTVPPPQRSVVTPAGIDYGTPNIPEEMQSGSPFGSPQLTLMKGASLGAFDPAARSLDQIVAEVEEYLHSEQTTLLRSPEADKATLQSLEKGNLIDPGIALIPGSFSVNNVNREFSLPVYTGSDGGVEALTAKIRRRILAESITQR